MKRLLLASTIIVGMLTSSCKKTPEKATNIATERETHQDSIAQSPKSDHITVREAAKLISNFLTDETFLRNVGRGRALGGILPIADFSISPDTISGVNMWFSHNGNNPTLPIFFLGVESTPNLDMTQTTPGGDLRIPGIASTFTYTESKTDDITVEEYLKNKAPGLVGPSINLPRTNAPRYLREFNALHSANRPAMGGKFCDRPFSFFQNNTISVLNTRIPNGLNAFLTQKDADGNNVQYVRYYFGYEKDNLTRPHNKIRIILFAVDSNGNNLISSTRTAPIILQRSVPPNP